MPARVAWREYQAESVYVCQHGRSFRDVRHLAFYNDGAVQPLIPQILERHDGVLFSAATGATTGTAAARYLAGLVERVLPMTPIRRDKLHDVFVLTGPDDPLTVRLPGPIPNESRGGSGWQNQRYTGLERLRAAKRTSQL